MVKVLNKNHVEYLDVKDEFGRPEQCDLFSDGLHPNDKGHEKLADIIAKYIKTKQ